MKKILLTLLAAAIMGGAADALAFEADNLTFNVTSETTAEVAWGGYTDAVITIPAEVTNEKDGKSYTVTGIASYAFNICNTLRAITMPETIEYIGMYAFQECTALSEVTVPDNVQRVDMAAFAYCSGLRKINFGSKIETFGQYAFMGCTLLSEFNIDENNPYYYSDGAAVYNKDITKLILHTVRGGERDFEIPATVTEIAVGACANCIMLKSIDIPDSVTIIGEGAFNQVSNCTKMTIGTGLTQVGQYAFNGMNLLETLTVNAPVPPACSGDLADYVVYGHTTLIVPEESADAYKEADGWKNFSKIETSGIESITAAEFRATANGGQLIIEAPEGAAVSVYTTSGVCVYNGPAATLGNLAGGIYFVNCGARSLKIQL